MACRQTIIAANEQRISECMETIRNICRDKFQTFPWRAWSLVYSCVIRWHLSWLTGQVSTIATASFHFFNRMSPDLATLSWSGTRRRGHAVRRRDGSHVRRSHYYSLNGPPNTLCRSRSSKRRLVRRSQPIRSHTTTGSGYVVPRYEHVCYAHRRPRFIPTGQISPRLNMRSMRPPNMHRTYNLAVTTHMRVDEAGYACRFTNARAITALWW